MSEKPEGPISKCIRETTQKTIRELMGKLKASKKNCGCDCSIAKMNPDGTQAILPDGSKVDTHPIGKVGRYAMVCGDTAYGLEYSQFALDLSNSGFLMETDEEGNVYVRRIGSSIRFTFPDSLLEDIRTEISRFSLGISLDPDAGPLPRIASPLKFTTGGFSASGNHLYLAGAFHVKQASLNNPNGVTDPISSEKFAETYIGENVFVFHLVMKNFSLDSENGSIVTAESHTSHVTNISAVCRNHVSARMRAPMAGENGDGEVPGLAGADRSKKIYRFFYDGSTQNTVSIDEINAFIQDIADQLGLTFEEVANMFPPDTWARAVIDNTYGRFFPAIHIEYHAITPGLSSQDNAAGHTYTQVVSAEDDGFLTDTWEADETIQPIIQEFSFVFTNDANDNPVMDLVMSYNSTTIYRKTSQVFETQFHWHKTVECFQNNITQFDFDYIRGNPAAYFQYSYNNQIVFDPNYAFSNAGVTRTAFMDYITVAEPVGSNVIFGQPFPPQVIVDGESQDYPNYAYFVTTLNGQQLEYQNRHFNFYSGGPQDSCNGNSSSECDHGGDGFNRIYTTQFFSEYGGEVYIEGVYCPFYNPACPYTESAGVCWEAARVAMNLHLQTPSPLDAPLGLPESGTYNFTRFDGTTVPYFTIVPTDPKTFAYWQSAYGLTFGCWSVWEDVNNPSWPGNMPFMNPYEIGRGVLVIRDFQTIVEGGLVPDEQVDFIDRPLPNPHDYDHIWRVFRGPDGGSALLIKDDFLNIWSWNRNYIATTAGNQELYEASPDLISDQIVIPAGEFPYPAEAAKYFESTRLIMYYTAENEGVTSEYLQVVSTPLAPTEEDPIAFQARATGAKPDNAGTLVDYVIRGA